MDLAERFLELPFLEPPFFEPRFFEPRFLEPRFLEPRFFAMWSFLFPTVGKIPLLKLGGTLPRERVGSATRRDTRGTEGIGPEPWLGRYEKESHKQ